MTGLFKKDWSNTANVLLLSPRTKLKVKKKESQGKPEGIFTVHAVINS